MVGNQSVGILAYGSLIGDPGKEIEEVRTGIKKVCTPFPVEYARKSEKRGNAPTLVPYSTGGCVRAQVFVVDTSVEDAKNRLYRREINKVGSEKTYTHEKNPKQNTIVIDCFENMFGLDIVLSTQIGATIKNPNAHILACLAIASVAKAEPDRDGISYLMCAMQAGVKTPLTADYCKEILRLTGASNLQDALEKARENRE